MNVRSLQVVRMTLGENWKSVTRRDKVDSCYKPGAINKATSVDNVGQFTRTYFIVHEYCQSARQLHDNDLAHCFYPFTTRSWALKK